MLVIYYSFSEIFNCVLDQTKADSTLIIPNDKLGTNYLRQLNKPYVRAITNNKRSITNCGRSNEFMYVGRGLPLLQCAGKDSVYTKTFINGKINNVTFT